MNDIQYYIVKLPQSLQDKIGEYNVIHRVYYNHVMKELESVFTCHLCKNIYVEGYRYRSEYDQSIIYCSTMCRYIRGWIGLRYSN